MDLITEPLKNLVPLLNSLALPLLFVFTAFFVVYRTGNFGLISNKIWSFFIGEKKYYDETLEKLEQNEHDVARFNFKNNLKFKKKSQVIKFINNINKYNLDVGVYAGLRGYYNPETDKVKKYKSSEMIVAIVVFVLSACILLPLMITASSTRTLQGFESYSVPFYTIALMFCTFIISSDILEKLKSRRARRKIYYKKCEYRKQRKP
ncbi:hypothetical protein FEI17_09350 [Kosakonia radicincitans]|uniref:DUF6216 family protein n=1 Tax=Kosakonia radicincitans TaxID=283686 RepID=UPI0011EBB645|nr:DUF6216 family protein [Kosakonia radicincitans]QEM90839.1 hypothetical protein FEI17_09350 [Kosakonia radicincitans]